MHPGIQRLDGEQALWYVRTRHADSDYYRARRQQQVLLSLREVALRRQTWLKLPRLVAVLSESIKTDLRPHDLVGLAILGKDIEPTRIVHRVIDETMATTQVMDDGAQVEVPDLAAVRGVVREVFSDGNLVAEAARIEIQNGANRDGLAGRTASWLRDQGVSVSRVGNAPVLQPVTTLIDYGGKEYTRQVVAKHLKIAASNVRVEMAGASDVDIRVILGLDFALPGP
jgi:hypothetical protein